MTLGPEATLAAPPPRPQAEATPVATPSADKNFAALGLTRASSADIKLPNPQAENFKPVSITPDTPERPPAVGASATPDSKFANLRNLATIVEVSNQLLRSEDRIKELEDQLAPGPVKAALLQFKGKAVDQLRAFMDVENNSPIWKGGKEMAAGVKSAAEGTKTAASEAWKSTVQGAVEMGAKYLERLEETKADGKTVADSMEVAGGKVSFKETTPTDAAEAPPEDDIQLKNLGETTAQMLDRSNAKQEAEQTTTETPAAPEVQVDQPAENTVETAEKPGSSAETMQKAWELLTTNKLAAEKISEIGKFLQESGLPLELMKDELAADHGLEVAEAMIAIHGSPSMKKFMGTLEKLTEKYGLSKERVNQLLEERLKQPLNPTNEAAFLETTSARSDEDKQEDVIENEEESLLMGSEQAVENKEQAAVRTELRVVNIAPGMQSKMISDEYLRLLALQRDNKALSSIHSEYGSTDNRQGGDFLYKGDTETPQALEAAIQDRLVYRRVAESLAMSQEAAGDDKLATFVFDLEKQFPNKVEVQRTDNQGETIQAWEENMAMSIKQEDGIIKVKFERQPAEQSAENLAGSVTTEFNYKEK